MQAFDGERSDGHRDSTDQLDISVASDPTEIRITLVGELDLATAPSLDRTLAELLGREGSRVLIDMVSVSFMDSTGLASLLRAVRDASARGHRLTVSRSSPQVQRLLELTGTLEQLTVAD